MSTKWCWRIWHGENITVQFQFEPSDLWIGLFWRRTELCLHFYVCFVPMFPLHVALTSATRIEEWTAAHSDE